MIDIISQKKIYFTISAILVVVSLAFFFIFGLNLGIDFTGGSLMEMTIKEQIDNNRIEKIIEDSKLDIKSVRVQKTDKNNFIIKTSYLGKETHNELAELLNDKLTGFEEIKFEDVGPTVGKDLQGKAIWSVIVAALGIILYIWWAFRSLPSGASSFQFGVSAIVALLHDVLIVVGVFSLLGHFFTSIVVDSYFIVALLTVMGFSVHDTIVVFDRLRENLIEEGSEEFERVANESVNQTLVRSINTSLTLLIVLLSMYFLAGGGIQNFILALTVGVVVGAYSSIFVASPFVSWWHNKVQSND